MRMKSAVKTFFLSHDMIVRLVVRQAKRCWHGVNQALRQLNDSPHIELGVVAPRQRTLRIVVRHADDRPSGHVRSIFDRVVGFFERVQPWPFPETHIAAPDSHR